MTRDNPNQKYYIYLDHNFVVSARLNKSEMYGRLVLTIGLDDFNIDDFVGAMQTTVDATLQHLNDKADQIGKEKEIN